MADRSVSSQHEDDDDEISTVHHADPPYIPHLRFTDAPTQGGSDTKKRACGLELSNSPSLRPGSAARDSGYNTDVSPAATISPATNTPRQQHFVFENLSHSHSSELEERLSTHAHVPTFFIGSNEDRLSTQSHAPHYFPGSTEDRLSTHAHAPPYFAGSTEDRMLTHAHAPPYFAGSAEDRLSTHAHPPQYFPGSTEDRLSTHAHVPPYFAGSNTPSFNSSYHFQFDHCSKSTPPLRLSPDIFKISASPGRTACPGTRTSSRPMSEDSDTNRVQFDFESEDEEDSNTLRDSVGGRLRGPVAVKSGEHLGMCDGLLGLHLPDLGRDSDEDDDEDVFYKNDEVLKNWGVVSEPQTPKIRQSSLAMRQRRYCSAEEDDSHLGACGGRELISCSTNQGRNRSLSESSRGYEGDIHSCVRKLTAGHFGGSCYVHGRVTTRCSEPTLNGSHEFQPCHVDNDDDGENDDDSVFAFHCDDINDEEISAQLQSSDAQILETFRQGMPLSPVFRARWRHISVTAHLRLSTGCLLPWSATVHRMSVSTQTPHMTSLMIQQILQSPCPLPNEAIGTAAARLRRRQSEGGIPPGVRPLPDIIPFARDRALSVPDLQTLARMQRAREFGRELRRLSDEFHGLALSPVHEETDGRVRRRSILRRPFTHMWTYIKHVILPLHWHHTSRHRRSTSVDRDDDDDDSTTLHHADHTQDLPGD